MSGSHSLGITEEQRELLLNGLRYVRSSVLLEMRDIPAPEDAQEREQKLHQIASLVDQLNGSQSASATANV